ncbi:TIGR02679 family protein [Nocardia rhamnosiphila]
MTLPDPLLDYLSAPSLHGIWMRLRNRLERTGHLVSGTIRVDVDADAADRLSGLLGHTVLPGTRTLSVGGLDAALLRSSAGRGLVPVLAELTGGPLRDRPSERLGRRQEISALWADIEQIVHERGLSSAPWVRPWIDWLHSTGLLIRTAATARQEFDTAAHALALTLLSEPPHRILGELATVVAGNSHALDKNTLAGRLALRALCFAFDRPEHTTARDRIDLWRLAGITVDTISSTVLTWGLRPPGTDNWSAMMRVRADLGLVTHLTLAELSSIDALLTAPGTTVAACENPQVLQCAAEAGVRSPLICFSGNPSSAGTVLAERIRIRYHGDFDWPGIGIASRLHAIGAGLWRMSADDYRDAVHSGTAQFPLTGSPIDTPWDPELSLTMNRAGVAIHEESLINALLADLS